MKVEAPLLLAVRRWHDSLGPGRGGIVVAVSGGPDSVALLRALAALGSGLLVVAHFNHLLRGAESEADQEFVAELTRQLQARGGPEIRLCVERADIAAQARAEGENLESFGRQVRYAWLARVAQETGCRWIATGHTASDQAETVLHRLLRGTGLQGLRGIAPRRELAPGIHLVRPLLAVSRADVLAYLQQEQQAYREDSSNLDQDYTRNHIRHVLLPFLAERYNPAVTEVLAQLAAQAEEAWPEIETLARMLLEQAERPRAGNLLIFDRSTLEKAPPYRVREMFRLVWTREGWPLGGMTFAAWERVAALSRGALSSVDFPGNIRAACRERVVQLGRAL